MPTARRILGIAPAFACAIAAAVADAAPPDLTVEVVRGSEGRAVDAYLGACAVAGFGGVVLVVENDEVVLHRAYGAADPETGRANTIETRFDVGSIAKQIVATAMLVLQQDGRLAIDDPIALHVDGLVAAVPLDKRGVTIAHLLHHTSGLPVELSGRIDYASAPAVASALLGAPLRSPPGTTFEYNNRGYSLAAMIVERVAGEPFEQFAHRRLFDAAGLTHTGFCRDEDIPDDVTACGTEDGTSFGPAVRASYAWGHRGATGLLTTPADLYRWLDVVRHGDLLNDASRAALFRPGLADYALGWFVRRMGDQTTIWHGGSTIGFEALCSHERNERTGTERTIIQVSNSRGRSGTIPTIVGRILAGAGAPPKPATLDAPERAAMAGAFESAEGARIEIAAVGEFLRVAPANQAALDALSPPADAARAARVGERTRQIMQALIDGDGEPMREVVGAGIPLDWPERLGAHLRERLAPLGPLGPVEVMGTTTAGPASTTTVRFVGRDGRVAMALHWTGDALFRIGFVARYAREFGAYPTGRGALVAVDPETGRQVRLRFRRDGDGTVTALEIRSAAGDVLLRLRPAG